jgi:DNA ligase-1
MSIYDIIQELNAENGSNYKMDVLRKHADNTLLQRVLKMTYDKVDFTYGISQNTWDITDTMIGSETSGMGSFNPDDMELAHALDIIEEYFAKRKFTGHDARDAYRDLLYACDYETAEVIMGIINRDLRINMGRSNINKVFKGLIVKPVYMRCGLFKNGKKSKINPEGSIVQLKADGTYREFTVENGAVICNSRSGESYDYPILNQTLETYQDGHYIGELTVRLADGTICGRAIGNGLIKSMELPDGAEIVLDLWDYVTLEEYTNAANKIKGTTPYHQRLTSLVLTVLKDKHLSPMPHPINVIETHVINTIGEAMQHCVAWMEAGLEGGVWKDKDAIFRDGTSPQQEKMKLEIDAEVRIVGFKSGSVGTKREGKIGSIEFATDDGQVKGFASGFTDAELDDMDARRDEIMGMIMEVTCNDITKGRSNDHYALSHPRFVELRSDKSETDTLERMLETKAMAMAMGG